MLKFSDVLILMFAFAVAGWAASYNSLVLDWSVLSGHQIRLDHVIFGFGQILLWHFSFVAFELYTFRRGQPFYTEFGNILKATFLGCSGMLFIAILLNLSFVDFRFAVFTWTVSASVTIVSRSLLRFILRFARKAGHNLKYLVIVGTNRRALAFAADIISNPEWGYKILGYVDNENYSGDQSLNMLGKLDDFPEVLNNHVVDEVVMWLPLKSYYDPISVIMRICEEQGIVTRFLADLFDTKEYKPVMEPALQDGYWSIAYRRGIRDCWQKVLKRAIDILVSGVAIILLFPFCALVALAIKLDSSGPVFFTQTRLGLNKRRFQVFKFRTMVVDAEKLQAALENKNEIKGPAFKIASDPRITKLGLWLRKFSIDELPQFLNVFLGQMSLVGPRPLPERDYNGFSVNWHRRRFSVKPGLTCLWQVNGRNNVQFEEWMEMDMEYIDGWSLGLDFLILLKTIPAVFKGAGAY